MKSIALSLSLVLLFGLNIQAQQKVKERDLRGQWKMVFDIDEDFIEKEIEDENLPWFGSLVAESVSGLVFNVLDEIDVQFEFQDDHRLKVMVQVFGEDEVEYAKWYIDSKGALILDDDDRDDDVWLFDKGRLVAYERENGKLERQPVYLERVR
jgi:hypothetical protein